jgi:hypothetical protein
MKHYFICQKTWTLLVCGWISSLQETRIKGASLVGNTWRSSASEGCCSGSFILVYEPHGRAITCHS